MIRNSRTTIKELAKRYRAVLLKCALMNAMAAAIMLTGTTTAMAAPDPTSDYWARTGSKGLAGSAITSLPADLWASSSNTLTVTGNVGGAGLINVNYDMMGEGYASELTGTVIVNGQINLTGEWGGINLAGGRLKLNQDAANSTMGFFGAYGGTLDLQNNHAGDVLAIGKMGGSVGTPMNVAVDFNAATGAMDKLTIGSIEGTPNVKLSSVNVVADGSATTATWMDGVAVSTGDVTDSTTTVTSAGNTYTFTKSANGVVTVSGSGAPVIPPTRTLAESIADSSVDAFSAVGNVSVASDLGALAGASRNFTIYGNNHVIDGGNHAGVTVASGQTLTVNKAIVSNFTTAITNAGTVNLSDSVFNSAVSNTGTVNISGNVTLNAAMNGTIASTGTLTLGSGADLSGATLSGGTIKLTLPATAVDSAMINATSASNVSLDVNMSKVSREAAEHYVLTATTSGYTLTGVNNNRYAFSTTASFSLDDYKANPENYRLSGWTGGDLYILRLATAGEAAVEDLKNLGVPVSANEEKAIAALDDEVIDRLAPAQKAIAQRINTLLDAAAGNVKQMKQILREVAPEAAPSASSTASANAGAVMNVVSTRMGGGSPAPAGKGRSGGDYTAGGMTAWAQMMYNSADLHKADGFDADSTGFAAGFEYNINDSVKAGIGYAYTDTDLDTARSKTDVDTHTVFAYGEYKPDAFYVNGVLSYGHSKYDEKTKLTGLQSDYFANTFAAQAMAGYAINDIVTPEVGLRYTSVRQRAYTNALGAHLSGKTLDTWTWVGGVKASKEFRVDNTVVTPDARFALTYDFSRDGQNRMVTLANGASYVANGENMRRFGVELGVGATVKVNNNTDVSLSYEGKFKDHYTDHTILLNAKYNF